MVVLATQHNGGRSQIQMNFLQFGGDFPFLNHYKNSSDFGYADNSGRPAASEMDDNGYCNLPYLHSGYGRLFFIPLQSDRAGHYVLKWSGIGTLGGAWGGTVPPTATFTGAVASNVLTVTTTPSNPIVKGMTLSTGGRVGDQLTGTTGSSGTYAVIDGVNSASGSKSVSSGSLTNTVEGQGRFVILPNTNRIPVNVTAATVKITNIVFCHVDDEARLEAGETFGVKFMERLREANCGSIRFMDWQFNNTNGMGTWAHRRPVTYASWTGIENRGSVSGSVATQSGLTITVATTYSGFTGADRQILHFRMPASFSGIANNGTEAIVLAPNGGPTKLLYNIYGAPGAFLAGEPVHCFFSAERDAYILQDYGLNNGAPYEVCLQLCAELGAHPYFNLPAWCGNAAEDTNHWGYGLATMIKNFKTANSCGWMIEKIEGPNECWNFGGGFTTSYIAWKTQHRINGGEFYPLDPNNMVTGDGFDVSAFVYPSAAAGALHADITLVQDIPFVAIGSCLTSSNMDANGTGGADYRLYYVTAINVGGNPKKVTATTENAISGSYDGSGGRMWPYQYDNGNFYGRVLGRTMKRWHAAYGDSGSGRDTQYQFLIGVQTMYSNGLNLGAQGTRFHSPHWALVNGTGQKTYQLATHCATTNYFNPGDQNTNIETRNALTSYITNRGDTTAQAVITADYVDSFGDVFAAYQEVHNNWKDGLMPLGLHLTNYEGGWSPDYWPEYAVWTPANSYGPVSIVTAATKETQCKVTLPRTVRYAQFPGAGSVISAGDPNWVKDGQACIVGMQLDFFGVAGMTELNQGGPATLQTYSGRPGGLSFTSASDQIGWAPSGGTLPFVGQSVSVDCEGSPWPFGVALEKGKMYWVVARNVSPAWIKVSATKGGASITIATAPTTEDVVMQAGWRVLAVNDGTNEVTLDCVSTSFGTWTATPADVFSQRAVYDRGDRIVNVLRGKSKTCFDSPLKPGTGLQGWLTDTYDFHVGLSQSGFRSEFPSCFDLSTERASAYNKEHDGQIWGVLVNIHEIPDPPQWLAIKEFNEVESEVVYTAAFRYIR